MFGGFRIAVAVHLGGTRRVPGATKTTIFVDPAAPGSPQTTIFVDPAPPSLSQWPPGAPGNVWEGSKTIPMPFKTFLEPLRNHWDQLLPHSGRLWPPAASQCLKNLPLPHALQSSIIFVIQRPWGPPADDSAQVSCTFGEMPTRLVKPHCFD